MSDPDPTASSLPLTRAKREAIAAEQHLLERVHDRVDQLRRRAEQRVEDAAADRSGPTFQARFERDVQAHHHAGRAARYTFGDVESLAFGRLDLADGEVLHIGRVSVVDEDGEVLLVDWRAPAAAAFYQATSANPLGVARRRTLVTRGRELRDLDDELVDAEAAERLGLEAVTGQGALLAALSRERGPQMRDIVATIQAEQDRIIRAEATGTLVVTGGPGTGKTVVALHRVASLLYRDRARFEGRGILVVGPSRAFTEYTSRVLPSLGEDTAVQRPLGALAPPGIDVDGWDTPRVARLKGDPRLAELAPRVLAAVLPPIPPTTRFSFDGTTAELGAPEVRRLRARHLARLSADDPTATYLARRPGAEASLLALLWRTWRGSHAAAGHATPDEGERTEFLEAAAEFPQVRMLRRCFWPPLTVSDVAEAVHTGDVDLVSAADGILAADEAETLATAWAAADAWTIDDVGFLDEVAALIGREPTADDAELREEGIRLGADELRTEVVGVDVRDPDYRDFAHVVVDEAQDLSPMQWRAVARRAPFASWTVVGDLDQRSRLDEPRTWEEVARLIGRRRVEVVRLGVNYRTPAEVAELANEVLVAAGGDASTAPRAVRRTGRRPVLITTDDVATAVHHRVDELLRAADGTVAVLSVRGDVADLAAGLGELAPDDRQRVRVLQVRTAKGLEFDDVVVAAPEAILAEELGASALYVAVTRATRSLTLVTGDPTAVPGAGVCEPRRHDPPA